MRLSAFWTLSVLLVGGCSSGNVETSADDHGPAAPTLRHPTYDPYAAYGSSRATWTPPVINRDGTVVRPTDSNVSVGRPDYEHAQWATGAAGGSDSAPPGTF